MFKKGGLLVLILSILLITVNLFSMIGSSHPPSSIELEYLEEGTLEVTITHPVNDPSSHYIYLIEVEVNGESVLDENYDSQPSGSSFTYEYELTLQDDDNVEVTAYCNVGGELTGELDLSKGTTSETEVPELWPYHAALMVSGLVFLLSGMGVSRFLKKKPWWLKTHKGLQIIGSVLAIIALLIAIYMVENTAGTHFRYNHAYLGIFIIFMILLSMTLGFLQFRMKSKIKTIKTAHRWTGRITVVLMVLNILSGLSIAGLI